MNIQHVTCYISNQTVFIERDGKLIGRCDTICGEPRIMLNNNPVDMMVHLSRTDCDIIWDNWNTLEEMRQKRNG